MKTCVAGAAAPISPLGSQLAYSIGILCSEGQESDGEWRSKQPTASYCAAPAHTGASEQLSLGAATARHTVICSRD
jgi:hypothetical protein